MVSISSGEVSARTVARTALLLVLLLVAIILGPSWAQANAALSWSSPSPLYGTQTAQVPTAISCVSQSLCAVADQKGNVLISGDPNAAKPSWTLAPIDPTQALNAISCAATSLCVAVDDAGGVLASTAPGSAGGTWHREDVDGKENLTSVSCPSSALCVAVDGVGNVLTSNDPGASSPTWTGDTIDSGHALAAVSCTPASSCVAFDDAGDALASSSPSTAGSWHVRTIDATLAAMTAASCSPTVCVAVDSSGNALASGDPTATEPTWNSTGVDPLGSPTGVSCPTSGPCVVVDHQGGSLASEAPTSASPSWSAAPADTGAALVGVSCVPSAFCVAIDASGRTVSTAIPPPPVAETAASLTIVQPHPSIVGIPAVGERLRCLTGAAEEPTTTFSYTWLRDETPIAGAGTSSYKVAPADATHHLQCQVTATNTAGSASNHSAYVAIPAQGVLASVGETGIGAIRAGNGRVSVVVTCSAQAQGGCALALRLSAVESVRDGHILEISSQGGSVPRGARKVTVALGTTSTRLAKGRRATVSVALNTSARRLLERVRRLPVLFTLKGTVIGVLNAVLAQRRLALHATSGAHASGHLATVADALARPAPSIARTAGSASAKAVLSPTPYMGWDSYFAFGGHYSEAMILQQASQEISLGLQKRGYRYIWLDAGWWHGERGKHGEIVVNHSQWPHGMAWLARTLHESGFLVGLYTDAGKEGCGGAHQGSYNHYRQDANTFAAWGFDAVKVDFCGGVRQQLNPKTAYSSFHTALEANSSHRPMLLSICDFLEPGQEAGNPPYAQSAFSSYTFGPSVGNSWRTDTDVGSPGYVTFATVLRNLDADAAHPEAAGPGHWNDPDYLGPDQGLSAAQFGTQMSMWAILAAPLMVSDDLTRVSAASLSALEDSEVIAIDQDPAGVQGKLLSSGGGGQVWVKPLSDGSRAVALLNRESAPMSVATSAAAVGMGAAESYQLRNVWTHTSETTTGSIAAEVPGESTVLLRVSLTSRG